MPTFLVNSRMSKPLRARIEAAVQADLRQRTLFPNQARRSRYLRVLLLLGALGLAVFLASTYRQSRREVEARRAHILIEYRRLRDSVPKNARAQLENVARQLAAPASAMASDSPALGELLAQPFLYVRAERRQLERPGDVLGAARESAIDALATCLVTPPVNLRESTLLRAIGRAPAQGRVFSFGEALTTLDFFDSSFERELQASEHMQELERLATRLERDTLARGLSALHARILLLAVDEAKAPGVISDFDGEAPHTILLRAVDIDSGRVLWKHEARVDPAWISDKSRLAYSRPLDSCRLAHELLSPAATPPR